MGNLYKTFKTDSALEEEGAWVTVGDTEWKLRRLSSSRGRQAYNDAQRPYMGVIRQAQIQNTVIPNDIDRKIVRETLIKGIVVGWKDVTDENDKALEFNGRNVEKILTDLPDVATELMRLAGEIENYKPVLNFEIAKNSAAASPTS